MKPSIIIEVTHGRSGVNEPLNSLAKAGNAQLYSYRFDWDDRRQFVVGDFKKLFGAGHALEIPMLTGSTKLVGGPPVSNFMYPKGISHFYTSRKYDEVLEQFC